MPMRFMSTERRVLGFSIPRSGAEAGETAERHPEANDRTAETEAANHAPAARRAPVLLELDVGEHPLGRNIIPQRALPAPRAVDFSEASDMACRVMKAAARELGIAPETLNQRVRARLRTDRRKRRSRKRLREEDEEAWQDRVQNPPGRF